MSGMENRQAARDAALREEENGRSLWVLGGAILGMSGITLIFIWAGWRAGSWLWFWITAALGFFGLLAMAGGSWKQAMASRRFYALSETETASSPSAQPDNPLPLPEEGPQSRAA
jgi:hypothetical protein